MASFRMQLSFIIAVAAVIAVGTFILGPADITGGVIGVSTDQVTEDSSFVALDIDAQYLQAAAKHKKSDYSFKDDETEEVISQDGDKVSISSSRILRVTFDQLLADGSIITSYVKCDKDRDINVREVNTTNNVATTFCQKGQWLWLNFTISGASPSAVWDFESEKKVKYDFVDAALIVPPCSENWIMYYTACSINDTQVRYYTDDNACGTFDSLPSDNSTIFQCDFCQPTWQAQNTSCSVNDTLVEWYSDSEGCFAQTNLESDNQAPANYTYSCDFCTPNWVAVNTTCLNDIITQEYNDTNICFAQTELATDNQTPANQTFACNAQIDLDATGFDGETTDLTGDQSEVENLTLERLNYGKIRFLENLNFTRDIILSEVVNLTERSITVDSEGAPELNKSATIVFYNLDLTEPVVMMDGEACPAEVCQIISYEGGTLTFTVTHFTTFSAEEGDSGDDSPAGGGSSGGSSGGGVNHVPVTPVDTSENTETVLSTDITPVAEIIDVEPISGTEDLLTGAATGEPQNQLTAAAVAGLRDNRYTMIAIIVVSLAAAGYYLYRRPKKVRVKAKPKRRKRSRKTSKRKR